MMSSGTPAATKPCAGVSAPKSRYQAAPIGFASPSTATNPASAGRCQPER